MWYYTFGQMERCSHGREVREEEDAANKVQQTSLVILLCTVEIAGSADISGSLLLGRQQDSEYR